jgi:hypothetical protein
MMYHFLMPVALAALWFPQAKREPMAATAPVLSLQDRAYLDGLVKDFLFDPRGAERVQFETLVRTVGPITLRMTERGWLVPGKNGQPGTVYWLDGPVLPPPPAGKIRRVDFIAEFHARSQGKLMVGGLSDTDPGFHPRPEWVERESVGQNIDDHLAVAAWLYKLGKEDLAALALAAARGGEEEPRQRLREDLAWSAYAKTVHAYMVGADAEALAYGERFMRLYKDVAEGPEYDPRRQRYPQAPALVSDLKRRQKKGTFGKKLTGTWPSDFQTWTIEKRLIFWRETSRKSSAGILPSDFEKWAVEKKVTYLIDALEEVDARQIMQPGSVNLKSDRRVAELIRLGDAAVPALIDVLENDQRLTRSVHFSRDFRRHRIVLTVREAALTALTAIKGDTKRKEGEAKKGISRGA